MSDTPKSRNIVWHPRSVSRADREAIAGHKAATIWLTGLSGSGKSTLAVEVEKRLWDRGVHAFVLDGDNVRYRLNKDLGFSPADRTENIRRIAEVANLLNEAGIITLTAFISPYRSDRDQSRAIMNNGDFIEVYVECPIEVCEQRDPKGLYKKARAGEIGDFTGISAPYEPPVNPELVLRTDQLSLDECAGLVLSYLESAGIISCGSRAWTPPDRQCGCNDWG